MLDTGFFGIIKITLEDIASTSRRYSLLFMFETKMLVFDHIKVLYACDDDFSNYVKRLLITYTLGMIVTYSKIKDCVCLRVPCMSCLLEKLEKVV